MSGARRLRGEDGVSAVVGTLLMLTITVVVFSGLSIGVLEYFDDQDPPPRVDLVVDKGPGGVVLAHRGGAALSLAGGHLILNVDGIETIVQLSDEALRNQTTDGATWRFGESLCLAGTGCLYPSGTDVRGVTVVHENAVLMDDGGRATRPDLVVSLVGPAPDPARAGEPVGLVAKIANLGEKSSTSGSVTVRFVVDGTPYVATHVGAVAKAQPVLVTATGWTPSAPGSYSVQVTVDPDDAIDERSETNNDAAGVIVVLDPPTGIDLTVTMPPPDPARPAENMSTILNARVTNLGTNDAGPFVISYLVDGVEVASASVPVLVAGDTQDIAGTPAWTASLGPHILTAIVDVSHLVDEDDEANNEATLALDIAATTPDPGAAFLDADGDGLFDPDVDVVVTPEQEAQIRSGTFNAGAYGIVIPESFGPLSITGMVNFQANGPIRIDVDLTATNKIDIVSSGSSISLGGAVHSDDKVAVDGYAGIYLTEGALGGITLSSDNKIEIHVDAGSLDLTNAILDARDKIVLSARDDVVLSGASITTDNQFQATSESDDVWLDGASVTAGGASSATVGPSRTLHVSGLQFVDPDNILKVAPSGADAAVVTGTMSSGAWSY